MRNFEFEAAIYQLCSPYISNKIILEYLRAKDNKIYVLDEKNTSIIEVVHKNTQTGVKLVRRVNLSLKTCECGRITYFGYPCRHYFAALLQKGEDIYPKILSLVHSRWKLIKESNPHFPLNKNNFLRMKIFNTPKQKGKKKVVHKKTSQLQQQKILTTKNISNEEDLREVPAPPKRPLTAYFIYANEVREEFVKKFPSQKYTEVTREIANSYKNLSQKEREKYDNKAQKLKEEYEKDKAIYEQKFGKIKNNIRKSNSQSDKTSKKNIKKKKH